MVEIGLAVGGEIQLPFLRLLSLRQSTEFQVQKNDYINHHELATTHLEQHLRVHSKDSTMIPPCSTTAHDLEAGQRVCLTEPPKH